MDRRETDPRPDVAQTAEELAALARLAERPERRVWYLVCAKAFQRLAELRQASGTEEPPSR